MAARPVSDEFLKQVVAEVEVAVAKGHAPPGAMPPPGARSAVQVVAAARKLSQAHPVTRWLKIAEQRGLYRIGPTPVELRDAAFWRRRAKTLADELAGSNHLLAQVAGLVDRPLDPPKWALPAAKASGKSSRAVGLLQISDVHGGEIVRANEVAGLNAYDLDVCAARLKRLYEAAARILPRWSADCRLEGVYVALNGDLVSGDIHDELRRTNALTAQEQVWFVADRNAAGIELLAEAFGRVVVVVTPGNHGRSTIKTNAKTTAALNYDTMIGEALRRHFAGDRRVTVVVSPSRDAIYEILGWRVLQTHGDEGGGGGQGFAGPVLPIVRKNRMMEFVSAQTRDFFDIVLTGHYHLSTNPTRKHFGNGSVVGYSEFARQIRAEPEPPMQWLLLVTERWGVRERLPIVLEDPRAAAPSPSSPAKR
ncbi:hypothetical protein DFR50_14232 [Roseiarcus fermentans]|uniref:Calcineurin-like phosphoesterase family protein n=1 Tax=Roseiarcus fermentans TaxID=1473586 RepID=A0A366END6_9HYPH|nr:hypothetical protein [Roseiarcus fermentans]RBP03784.1 hypothetical protein DFR50_14232 [Roseiarcus fermentans]